VETASRDEATADLWEEGFAAYQSGQAVKESVIYATPKYDENPLPPYPTFARKRGYEGRTLLRVEVLESGKVGGIEIADSSGFDVLDKAARKAVKNWDFVPGTKNGKVVRQWVFVPVRFSLK
jgi:protein TonB